MTFKEIVYKHLSIGRMIGFSKSGYREEHPNDKIYFNAQIHDADKNFIWAGDLNITKDMSIIREIEVEYGKKFYITPELWGKFDDDEIKKDSTLVFGV